jgi:hypothetical protein
MKTSQIQAVLMLNADQIDLRGGVVRNTKAWLKHQTPNETCTVREFYNELNFMRRIKRELAQLVALQIDLKRQLQAAKTPRPAGSRNKHNRSDPRYVAWYTAQHAERTVMLIGEAGFEAPPASCGC